MKKTILFHLVATLSMAAFGQQKDSSKTKADTLTIDLSKVQYIKVGSTVVKAETLQEKGFWMPLIALQQLREGLGKFPYDNSKPIIEYFEKFFGIK
jgi:hypothetical protein